MRWLLLALTILLLGGTLSTGCVAVKPWQRSTLSHRSMLLTPRLGEPYHAHLRSIREGAVGGEIGAGGGCGCN